MRVGRPRVGAFDAEHLILEPARRPPPQAECAVYVDPDIVRAHRVAYRTHGIERPAVHVSRLGAHDRGTCEVGKRVGAHASLVVGRHPHHPVATEPEHPERLEQRGVRLRADQDGDLRRGVQSVPVHIVTMGEEHRAPGRRKGSEVGHRRTGDECHPCIRRQSQSLDDPPHRHLLQRGADRRAHLAECVLIPCRGEPARGHRRRQGAAGDEAEVPRTRARDHALTTDLVETYEDLRRGQALARQCTTKHRHELAGIARCRDAAFGKGFQKSRRALVGFVQQLTHVVHASSAPDFRGFNRTFQPSPDVGNSPVRGPGPGSADHRG